MTTGVGAKVSGCRPWPPQEMARIGPMAAAPQRGLLDTPVEHAGAGSLPVVEGDSTLEDGDGVRAAANGGSFRRGSFACRVDHAGVGGSSRTSATGRAKLPTACTRLWEPSGDGDADADAVFARGKRQSVCGVSNSLEAGTRNGVIITTSRGGSGGASPRRWGRPDGPGVVRETLPTGNGVPS